MIIKLHHHHHCCYHHNWNCLKNTKRYLTQIFAIYHKIFNAFFFILLLLMGVCVCVCLFFHLHFVSAHYVLLELFLLWLCVGCTVKLLSVWLVFDCWTLKANDKWEEMQESVVRERAHAFFLAIRRLDVVIICCCCCWCGMALEIWWKNESTHTHTQKRCKDSTIIPNIVRRFCEVFLVLFPHISLGYMSECTLYSVQFMAASFHLFDRLNW